MSDGQPRFESLHMTDEEVQEVVALHEENRRLAERMQAMASVEDVSEAMSLSESEVAKLLSEVRRRKSEALQQQETTWRRRNRWTARDLVLLFAMVIAIMIVFFFVLAQISPGPPPEAPDQAPIAGSNSNDSDDSQRQMNYALPVGRNQEAFTTVECCR